MADRESVALKVYSLIYLVQLVRFFIQCNRVEKTCSCSFQQTNVMKVFENIVFMYIMCTLFILPLTTLQQPTITLILFSKNVIKNLTITVHNDLVIQGEKNKLYKVVRFLLLYYCFQKWSTKQYGDLILHFSYTKIFVLTTDFLNRRYNLFPEQPY